MIDYKTCFSLPSLPIMARSIPETERREIEAALNSANPDMRNIAGETRTIGLRGGIRQGELTKLTPMGLFFDPRVVYSTSLFSRFMDGNNFEDLIKIMRSRGICTEFDSVGK